MPLVSGEQIGQYKILSLIGAGGMGEVYRAADTQLKRDVALKVLLPEFARDPERYTRFQREAEVLASLHHPNIATVYGLAENALVMELVEGQTLPCPLPLDTAIAYAKQIAEALEYAHDRAVIHRDLKPLNVKVTPDGVVKLLDFGLAKALDNTPAPASTSDLPNSPTLTLGHTMSGQILGTAAYMAPEQVEGRAADRRADIWAFGAVLFEMLTGKRAFDGTTSVETLATVMKSEPDWSALPASTPPHITALLKRCLTKDRKQRLQAIGEARIAMEAPVVEPRREAADKPGRPIGWMAAAAVFALLAGTVSFLHFREKPSDPPVVSRFPISLGEGQLFSGGTRLFLGISPDGTKILYAANQRLYLRSLGELEARVVAGTDGQLPSNPVFSPDGRYVAFHAGADGTLKKLAITGGTPITLCQTAVPAGVSWTKEGIVFAQGRNIFKVSENGGKSDIIVAVKDGEVITRPQLLPGGETVLFTVATGSDPVAAYWDRGQIVVQTLKTGARKVVHDGGRDARYLPTGHLVYALAGTLFAVPFDLKHLEAGPGAVPLVEGVQGSSSGAAEFSFSENGSLIYSPGPDYFGPGSATPKLLAFIDRKGSVEAMKLPPGSYGYPRVSRDGRRVAYETEEGKESAIWTYELSGAHEPNRLTLAGTGANRYPIWSWDGTRIAFQSDREGDQGIWWQRADGSGPAERLTKPEQGVSHIPDSWSPDGQTFSFTAAKGDAEALWTFSTRDKKATLFREDPVARLGRSVFSPNGRWLAYQQRDGADVVHIYIQTYPPTPTRFQISKAGGFNRFPVWSQDGKELFYMFGTGANVVEVSITEQPSFSFAVLPLLPRPFNPNGSGFVRGYDLDPDGKRFIGLVPAGQGQSAASSRPSAPQIQVVLKWFEDLKQRMAN